MFPILDHIMQQEFTATCTDGGIATPGQGLPHARFYGTTARKLRYYTLDHGVITLPFAIRSLSGLPAQILGLKDRGLVRVGHWADLVVFDPAIIADKATFTELHQYPTGIPTSSSTGSRSSTTASSRVRRRARSSRRSGIALGTEDQDQVRS